MRPKPTVFGGWIFVRPLGQRLEMSPIARLARRVDTKSKGVIDALHSPKYCALVRSLALLNGRSSNSKTSAATITALKM